MDWLLYLTLAAILLAGLGLNLVGLPGLWLMVAGHAAYAWATGWVYAGLWSILAVLLLAVAAEVVEFIAGAAGSRKAGGSWRSGVGAVIGGVIGAIAFLWVPVPVLNAVVGACIGSFIGAAVMEATIFRREVDEAVFAWSTYTDRLGQVGWGAFKGRLWGILLKTAFGVVILVVSLATAW